MFRTHLAFGLFLGLLFLKYFDGSLVFLFFVGLFSVLADIDYHKSKVGKKVKLFSWLLNKIAGHRGVLHTVYFLMIVFFILISFGKDLIGYAFLIGYSSHLFMDMLTKRGIKPFYPLKMKINGFIRTGGRIESLVFYVVLILDIFYIVVSIA